MADVGLKRLNRLRRYDGQEEPKEYLSVEMEQNYRALEDTIQSLTAELDDLKKRVEKLENP